MELLKHPNLKESMKALQNGIAKSHCCILSANCSVRYSGRAESFLPLGDRIIFIKPDTTILLHQTSGSQPVNWMPGKTVHNVIMEDGKLSLISTRQSPSEKLKIDISKIHFINTMQMEDTETIQTVGTEKDMADMIMNNPDLISNDFKPVNQEEQTKYGFIDVMGKDKDKNLVIVECKRYNADLSAVTQLRRYVEKIKNSKGIKNVKGIVAAPKISKNALQMLNDWGFEFKKVEPPKYFEERKKSQTKLDGF
jgi:RecB family endonuclease NucS